MQTSPGRQSRGKFKSENKRHGGEPGIRRGTQLVAHCSYGADGSGNLWETPQASEADHGFLGFQNTGHRVLGLTSNHDGKPFQLPYAQAVMKSGHTVLVSRGTSARKHAHLTAQLETPCAGPPCTGLHTIVP